MDINNNDDIDALVLRCQTENPFGTKAFKELVTLFQPTIYRLCLNYMKNESDAEETTQNIFIKVFHNVKKFKGESKFKTWLYRIAINQCTDLYNKRKKQAQMKAEMLAERGETGQGVYAERLEQQDDIATHLEKLNPQEREILILRFYEDLKIQEIAEALGIQLSAAKMRLSRALDHFKLIYDP